MMLTVLMIPFSSDGALGGGISKHKQLGSKQQSIDPGPAHVGASTPIRQRSNIKNWVVQPKGSCVSLHTRASTDDKAFQKLGPILDIRKKASNGDHNFLLARNEVDL